MYSSQAARHPIRFALLRSPADIERLSQNRRVLLTLGMENGATIGDELATASCDLDRCKEIKDNVFNFALHREPQHYRLIAETKGAVEPD